MTETEQSSTEEQDLVQEALDTEESPVETSPAGESDDEQAEKGVPVVKHAELRKRAQAAELREAELKGQLSAIQQMQVKQAPAAKSPIDLEIERQTAEGVLEEDMIITPALYRKQRIYDQQVATQAAQTAAKQALGTQQVASANKAKIEHDDWQQIVTVGESLLTAGEMLDISNAGADFGELAYEKCRAAIANSKSKTKSSETAPEKTSKPKTEEKVATQAKILADTHVDPIVAAVAKL